MKTTSVLVMASLSLLLIPAAARAEGPSATTTTVEAGPSYAKNRIGGTIGFWTPVGELGAEYTYVAAPSLEVGFGVGLGFSGPQAAVTPRLRAGSEHVTLTIGPGLSAGRFEVEDYFCFDETDCMDAHTTALWGNLEAGLTVTASNGAFLRAFGGVGRILSNTGCVGGDDVTCDDVDVGTTLPFAGLTVGKAY